MNLDSELVIETPEHVELRFALASVGTRFLASLIDHMMQGIVIVIGGLILGVIGKTFQWVIGSSMAWAIAIVGLLMFLIIFGYFTFFETIWSGQTPGKRWMKLRVIRDDGRPIGFFEAMVRNILRVVDFFPSGYATGVVSIILSPEARRMGDYVAGTVVVKERSSEAPALQDILEHHTQEIRRDRSRQSHGMRLDVRTLNKDEITAVEVFLMRRNELPPTNRPWIAARIALPLINKLRVVNVADYEAFLEDVDRQYRAQRKYFVDTP